LRRKKFFQGRAIRGTNVRDIAWLAPDGHEMTDAEWDAHWVKSIAVRLDGSALDEVDEDGHTIVDDDLLLILNAHTDSVQFTLPPSPHNTEWEMLIDTRCTTAQETRHMAAGATLDVIGKSLVLLCAKREV